MPGGTREAPLRMKTTLRNIGLILWLPALALLLAGCGKDSGTVQCDFRLLVQLQEKSEGELTPAPGLIGFYFYGDTTLYHNGGYEQLTRGELAARDGGAALRANGEAVRDGEGVLVFPGLTEVPVTLLFCDTVRKIYALRLVNVLEPGIDALHTRLNIELWSNRLTFLKSQWIVTIPPVVEPEPDPEEPIVDPQEPADPENPEHPVEPAEPTE